MTSRRIPFTLSGLRLAALLALATPVAFSQNSFNDSIHKNKSQPASNEQSPSGGNSSDSINKGSEQASVQPTNDPRFAKVAIEEARDFGVPATSALHNGPMHGPTPTQIPGGLVVTTEALDTLYKTQTGQFIVFDVLGGPQGLPNAQNAIGAAQAGSFNDHSQQQFGQYLQQLTNGNKQVPLVFYCQSIECWMSYNAALRAINLGYTQVLWYRGGIEAWQSAGLQTFGNQGGQQ